jgi:hypothetical protein
MPRGRGRASSLAPSQVSRVVQRQKLVAKETVLAVG